MVLDQVAVRCSVWVVVLCYESTTRIDFAHLHLLLVFVQDFLRLFTEPTLEHTWVL